MKDCTEERFRVSRPYWLAGQVLDTPVGAEQFGVDHPIGLGLLGLLAGSELARELADSWLAESEAERSARDHPIGSGLLGSLTGLVAVAVEPAVDRSEEERPGADHSIRGLYPESGAEPRSAESYSLSAETSLSLSSVETEAE